MAVNEGLPSNPDARVLATDPVTAGTLYAGLDRYGVYKSTDAGQAWRPASAGLTAKAVRALVVAPSLPGTLYVGTENGGVYRSTDAARSWQAVNTGLEDLAVRALAVDPRDAGVVYAGTSRAVFKTTDAGAHWVAAVNGLAEVTMNALAIDPGTPEKVYVATEGEGLFRSPDGGATWYPSNAGLSDWTVRVLAADPTTADTVYTGTGGALFKSENSGAQWQTIAGGPNGVTAIVIDPTHPATLYASARSGTTGAVYKSTDAGETWAFASDGLPAVPIDDLAMNPANPTTLYVGLSDQDGRDPWLGGVYKTTDGGKTWQRASDGIPAAVPTGDPNLGRVVKIGIDPTAPG